MKRIINNILGFVLVSIFVLNTTVASAYVYGDVDNTYYSQSTCVNLTNNMRLGDKDSTTGYQVSDLQNFLINRGYLSGDPTGYFGAATQSAVKRYQSAKNLLVSGYVGDVTRSTIRVDSCGGTYTPAPVSGNYNYSTAICALGSTYSYTNSYPVNKCACPAGSIEKIENNYNIYGQPVAGAIYFRCVSNNVTTIPVTPPYYTTYNSNVYYPYNTYSNSYNYSTSYNPYNYNYSSNNPHYDIPATYNSSNYYYTPDYTSTYNYNYNNNANYCNSYNYDGSCAW